MQVTFENAKQRTNVPFRHDVVGSFLRPAALKEARTKYEAGQITEAELRKVEDEEVTRLVQKQKEVGLKGVTDGEFRRSWWHLDFFWGLEGVQKKVLDQGYLFHGRQTRAETAVLTGKIGCKVHPHLEHFKFLKSVAGDDVVARQNIPAPAQFLLELQRGDNKAITEQFYPNFEELCDDIVAAYRSAILGFYEAGCRNLQLDDCTWGCLCDENFRAAQFQIHGDIKEFVRSRVELNNRAIRGLPEDLTLTMHTCRGNYMSLWFGQGGYETIAEELFSKTEVSGFYLEYDTERAGGFEPLRHLKDKQVVVGLISSKLPELEDKEQIIARIAEVAKVVDINRICISPQCGFASTEEGNCLTEEEQWNKLRFIKEIADQIWH